MKKIFVTAAAVAAAITMLAGCSNGETPDQSNQSGQSTQSTQSSQSSQSSQSNESSSVSSDEPSSVTSTSGETSSTESTSSDTSSAESTASNTNSEPSVSDKPVSVADLSLKDGEYTIGVKLEGGSGKTKVTTPAKLIVKDGAATAEVEFSSSKYDYMKVDGTKYDMINTEGNSKFLIPVSGFDYKMPVIANTTAMGNPHEIEYTLFFDSKTIS